VVAPSLDSAVSKWQIHDITVAVGLAEHVHHSPLGKKLYFGLAVSALAEPRKLFVGTPRFFANLSTYQR
jgi:hypothetical protein